MLTKLHPLPGLRKLSRQLADLNEVWAHEASGPEFVVLYCSAIDGWRLGSPDSPALEAPLPLAQLWPEPRELVGVAGFDATACARRLLSQARSAGWR